MVPPKLSKWMLWARDNETFQTKTKRTKPYPQLPQIWGKNKKQKQQNQTKQKPYHKTNGTAAVNRAVSQARGLVPPWGECPGCVPSPLTREHWRFSDIYLNPFLTSSFFSHLSLLSLSLPSTSHLSAFGFNVFGVLFYPKISVWEIFFSPLCCVEPSFFFQHLYCFLLVFLLLLSWHFC